MTNAEKYVTAAYLAVLGAVLLYVVIYSFKIARLRRDVEELADIVARRTETQRVEDREPAPGPVR